MKSQVIFNHPIPHEFMVLIRLTWEKEKIDWTLEPHAFEPRTLGVVFQRRTLHKKEVFHHEFSAELVAFTKEILNGKLHFLCSAWLLQNKNERKQINQRAMN